MIFCEYAAPIPGSASSSSLVAVLMSSLLLAWLVAGSADCGFWLAAPFLALVFCAFAPSEATNTSARHSAAKREYRVERFICPLLRAHFLTRATDLALRRVRHKAPREWPVPGDKTLGFRCLCWHILKRVNGLERFEAGLCLAYPFSATSLGMPCSLIGGG